MAKKYRVTRQVRIVNRVIMWAIRVGIFPRPAYILTVQGRKTGKPYRFPVSLVEAENGRWIVSPYGEVNWVRNVRATGEVLLSRRGLSEVRQVAEVPVDERAPILKTYFDRENYARQFTDFTPDTPLETFAEAAGQHPVFKLI